MNENEFNVKSLSKLFIFYKKLNKNQNDRVIIYADTYIEAKELLFAYNAYADQIYNLTEYKLQHVLTDKLFEICKIDEEFIGYPFIVAEYQYMKLEPYINDKQFSDIQHTKVLTKNLCDVLSPEIKTNTYSTGEFVNLLQEKTDLNIKYKKEIKSMLNTVGDIWFIKIGESNKLCTYIYGKSRYQCLKIVKDLDIKDYHTQPELLIKYTGNTYDNIVNTDINNYEIMVSYMKKYNIKKFPFITSNHK